MRGGHAAERGEMRKELKARQDAYKQVQDLLEEVKSQPVKGWKAVRDKIDAEEGDFQRKNTKRELQVTQRLREMEQENAKLRQVRDHIYG